MQDISSLTIAEIRSGLAARKFSALELARAAIRFAEAENPKTNAYLTLCPEVAEAAARAVDDKLARGEDPGLLAGVPVAVKDVLSTKGVRTTCASRLLERYVPPYDATAVERLKAAGAVMIGKANCDEFAMGSSNENSAFGAVRNPVALDRVPGAPVVDRRRWWHRVRRSHHLVPTPADPSGSRPRFVAWWASRPPTDA